MFSSQNSGKRVGGHNYRGRPQSTSGFRIRGLRRCDSLWQREGQEHVTSRFTKFFIVERRVKTEIQSDV